MRPKPRTHLLPAEVAKLLQTAAKRVESAEVAPRADPQNRVRWEGLFVAEQTQLLVRLAADTAARRGELATLRLSDLNGRVRTIERNLSLEVLGPTKTGWNQRMTIGATTAEMIHDHFAGWDQGAGPDVVQGDWVFSPDFRRLTYAAPICCPIGSADSARWPIYRTRRCTGSAKASPPTSSRTASSSKPRPGRRFEAFLCGGYYFVPALAKASQPWTWIVPPAA